METPVLVKIGKLLKLAQDQRGATEAERTIAAEHVQRLLQEHNLTLSEVEAQGGSADTGTREKSLLDRRAMYQYQRQLMRVLADNHFCLHQIHRVFDPEGRSSRSKTKGRYNNRHFLIGRAVNVQATVMTYDYLTEAMRRAADEAGYDVRTAEGKTFLEGTVSRLQERLAARLAARLAEDEARKNSVIAPTGNGSHRELILSDVYGSETDLNNDLLNGFPAGTTAAKRREVEERRMRAQARHEELVAQGEDSTIAWYMVHGYGREEAAALAVSSAKAANARSRPSRAGRGRTQTWTQGDERRYAKVNSSAYRAGRAAGNDIGLDEQVGASARKKLTHRAG